MRLIQPLALFYERVKQKNSFRLRLLKIFLRLREDGLNHRSYIVIIFPSHITIALIIVGNILDYLHQRRYEFTFSHVFRSAS